MQFKICWRKNVLIRNMFINLIDFSYCTRNILEILDKDVFLGVLGVSIFQLG